MFKILLLIAILASAWHHFGMPLPGKPATPLEYLMQSAEAGQVDVRSGVKYYKSAGGPGFDVHELAEPGKITIVDFYADRCPSCKRLAENYKLFVEHRPDVAIRRIRMKNGWSIKWAKQRFSREVRGTPHVLIFDEQGQVVVQDYERSIEGYRTLNRWLKLEQRRNAA